ncbi:hypothetical protein [Crassaminicella profunda]|uniref:hypothetical protein n=1 Tax=Crassaminicella profunda TaxID=1286698 RepID=UPI001CA651CF|nr:hypothetical protein [Crassaminicella profunda]QZY57022.1 hypothetical protein K7H06_08925 [Crassaminicella profunda]
MTKSISNYNKSVQRKISEPAPYTTYERNINKFVNTKSSKISREITEEACILVDQVYSYCQQKDCFPKFKKSLPNKGETFQFIGIVFKEGYIAEGTLNVTSIGPKRPNFSRVKFVLKVPFTIRLRNTVSGECVSVNGFTPDIVKDVVLYMPEARDEFNFRIVIETRSEVLTPPEMIENKIKLPIGVLSVIRVVGRIQLSIPVHPEPFEPPEAENYEESEKSVRKEFDNRPFPDDFFPPQFQDSDISIQIPRK